MAAKSSSNHDSEMFKQKDLSSLTLEQLRGRLKEMGLPTTGRTNISLERLVNAQYVLRPMLMLRSFPCIPLHILTAHDLLHH